MEVFPAVGQALPGIIDMLQDFQNQGLPPNRNKSRLVVFFSGPFLEKKHQPPLNFS